jgi:uncharacterized membrane protein
VLLSCLASVHRCDLFVVGSIRSETSHARWRARSCESNLIATVGGLVGPGVSRLPFASGRPPVIGVMALAFLLAGPVYDLLTRRRVHPAYLWGGLLALATIPPVVAQLSATAAWHSIASWLLR